MGIKGFRGQVAGNETIQLAWSGKWENISDNNCEVNEYYWYWLGKEGRLSTPNGVVKPLMNVD